MRTTTDERQLKVDPRPEAGRCGFTLVEIMIAVGLLSFIILGLLAMFNQTQRAFRTSMTQTDVLESGRGAMDLITRELTQLTPSQTPDILINGVRIRATNFFSEPSPYFSTPPGYFEQALPAMPSSVQRTNSIQRFFFLSKMNQDWVGNGYEVLPEDPRDPIVGTLYRFSGTNWPRTGLITLSRSFQSASRIASLDSANGRPVTNLSRIADGVVHLRVRAYAQNGFLVVTNQLRGTNAFSRAPFGPGYNPYVSISNTIGNTIACADLVHPDQSATYFMGNAAPGYVDVELGILEPQVLQRYRSIPDVGARRNYLSNHVAQVHLFRQRVAIPNVDTTAYP